jgi:hypothetical protein
MDWSINNSISLLFNGDYQQMKDLTGLSLSPHTHTHTDVYATMHPIQANSKNKVIFFLYRCIKAYYNWH